MEQREREVQSPQALSFLPRILVGVGLFVALYGAGLFCAQVYFYLNTGLWVKLPSSYIVASPDRLIAQEPTDGQLTLENLKNHMQRIETISKMRPYLILLNPQEESWFDSPRSWIGLNKIVMAILNFLSIPFLSLAFGIAIFFSGLSLQESSSSGGT